MLKTKNSKIKILICAHKITKTIQTNILSPILLGADYTDEQTKQYFSKYLYDNSGPNISRKHPNYAELTAIYWAWKNMDVLGNPDYIGLFHYRRFFNFKKDMEGTDPWQHAFFDFSEKTVKRFGWRNEDIEQICQGADIITSKLEQILNPLDWNSPATLEVHYKNAHYAEDFDLAIETIRKLHPKYEKILDEFIHAEFGHYCNMFVMKRELFIEYAEWLFSILFEMEKHIDVRSEKYNGENVSQKRVFGFLGERLLICFLMYKSRYDRVYIRECQRLVGYLTKEEQKTYKRRYYINEIDPENLTFFKRIHRGYRLIYDGMKYLFKKVFLKRFTG